MKREIKNFKNDQFMISHNRSNYAQLLNDRDNPKLLYYFATHHENNAFSISGQSYKMIVDRLNKNSGGKYIVDYEYSGIRGQFKTPGIKGDE